MRISNPSRPFDVPVNVLDITRASEMLKWKPEIGIEEGLQREVEITSFRTGIEKIIRRLNK